MGQEFNSLEFLQPPWVKDNSQFSFVMFPYFNMVCQTFARIFLVFVLELFSKHLFQNGIGTTWKNWMPITSLGHPRIYNQNLNEIVSTFHYQALFSCIQLKIVGFEALDWEVKKLYPLLLNILKYGFRHLTLAITILFIRHVTHYKHRFYVKLYHVTLVMQLRLY